MAMWQASKHGQLFTGAETRDHSPTCVTCHMPKGGHDTSAGLSLGQVANGSVLEGVEPTVKMQTISKTDALRERNRMVQNCLPCHSSRFAAESLSKADEVKKEADALLFGAAKLIHQLNDEGILRRPKDAVAVESSAISSEHSLVLGGDQPYDGQSPIEQRFFDMFKYHHATTFKGAYHHSPEYTHNEGFLRMKQDITYLNSEAARLRAEARSKGATQKKSP